MIKQCNSNIKIVKAQPTEIICSEGRTCFDMVVSFMKFFLNKTFRVKFSSLLNMALKEIK